MSGLNLHPHRPHAAKSPLTPTTPHHDKLVKQSQRLVSQTFFGTMLKQMRNSPFKSKLFDGGRGGEAFSSVLDQHLADHMAKASAGARLVNSMVKHWERPKAQDNPNTQRTAPQPAALEQTLKKSGYLKPSLKDRRPFVPANTRA